MEELISAALLLAGSPLTTQAKATPLTGTKPAAARKRQKRKPVSS
jgi:hypothetical protein